MPPPPMITVSARRTPRNAARETMDVAATLGREGRDPVRVPAQHGDRSVRRASGTIRIRMASSPMLPFP